MGIHAPSGIQTRKTRKRSAADPRLRPLSHSDRVRMGLLNCVYPERKSCNSWENWLKNEKPKHFVIQQSFDNYLCWCHWYLLVYVSVRRECPTLNKLLFFGRYTDKVFSFKFTHIVFLIGFEVRRTACMNKMTCTKVKVTFGENKRYFRRK